MNTITLSELMQLDEQSVKSLTYPLQCTFIDRDPVEIKPVKTLLTWLFGRPFRLHPDVPPGADNTMFFRKYTKGFDLDIMRDNFWTLFNHRRDNNPVLYGTLESLHKLKLELNEAVNLAINDVHNVAVTDFDHYGTGTDVEHLYQIQMDPVLLEMKARAQNNEPERLNILRDEVQPYLKKKLTTLTPETARNAMCLQARSGGGKIRSQMQLAGYRGNVQSIDNDVYAETLARSFYDGLYNIGDTITDSPQAGKALQANEGPLQKSEYMNRVMQLFVQSSREVKGMDCGSTRTVPVMLNDVNDIKWVMGKNIILDDGSLMEVRSVKQMEPFLGTSVQVRSIVYCNNHDTSTSCLACAGVTGIIMPEGANMSHFVAAGPLGDISQLIMSTKHFDSTDGFTRYVVEPDLRDWLTLSEKDWVSVLLTKPHKRDHWRIRFKADEALNISVVQELGDGDMLAASYVSNISGMEISEVDEHGMAIGFTGFSTRAAKRNSSLSRAVLDEIRRNGYETIDGMVTADLYNMAGKPLFVTERRSEDMMAYHLEVKHFIYGDSDGSKEQKQYLRKAPTMSSCDDATEALFLLRKLFDVKLKTSMINAEVFVRAAMARDPAFGDYRLPRGDEPYRLVKAERAIMARSPVAVMAFESAGRLIQQPATYLNRPTQPHQMDPLLCTGYRQHDESEFKSSRN